MSEYIRGWRQLKAIWIFFECLFKGNWKCAKREIHILTGFAKPYSVQFHPKFWESLKEYMGEQETFELAWDLQKVRSSNKTGEKE